MLSMLFVCQTSLVLPDVHDDDNLMCLSRLEQGVLMPFIHSYTLQSLQDCLALCLAGDGGCWGSVTDLAVDPASH